MPEISIIVPVYKVENYLRRCIDSILAQTFTDFELILVDDGSPDNCPTICDEYASKDARIHVIHQSNQGQAAARNNGVSFSKGEWIHFVDSDDAIHPQLLESLYCAAIDNNVLISMSAAMEVSKYPCNYSFPKENILFSTTSIDENLLNTWCSSFYFHCVWAKLIHRTIIEKYPFTPNRFYEDTAIVPYWLFEASTICFTEEPLYLYFINPTGTTKGQRSIKKIKDNLWAHEELLNFAITLRDNFGYQTFHSLIVTKYMRTVSCLYFEALPLDNALAIQIRLKAIRFYKNNKSLIRLEQKDKLYAMEMIHPLFMRVYWICKSIGMRLRHLIGR